MNKSQKLPLEYPIKGEVIEDPSNMKDTLIRFSHYPVLRSGLPHTIMEFEFPFDDYDMNQLRRLLAALEHIQEAPKNEEGYSQSWVYLPKSVIKLLPRLNHFLNGEWEGEHPL